jgi:metallophosphoesterase superfamily enzyme
MKAIAIGDPHFRIDNIPDVEIFITKIEELVKQENPDIIIILGDLLHTHEKIHVTPLNKAYHFIDIMRKYAKTFVLVGNHDAINNQIFLTNNHWMNGMKKWKNVVIVDTVIHETIKNIHLVFCPYVPPSRFQEALNTNDQDWKSADCIFAHQEFYGCKMGAITSVDGDKWPDDYPNVISGHIHSNQKIQSNIYYCGSSMQHAFGESDKNIIPIITWENNDKNYILNEVDLNLPRKKIIYTDITEIDNIKPQHSGDKIKISISGNIDEFKAFKKTKHYKELINKGTKVVFKSDKKTIDEKYSEIKSNDFDKVLLNLVKMEKNNFLYQIYELVVHDKKIDLNDILIL